MPGNDEGRPPQGVPAHIEALRPTEAPSSSDPNATELAEYVRNVPGRCRGCGNHTVTEGHALDCPERADMLCGRCSGPADPEGAWCDNCIRICGEYTRWPDLQRDKREAP
jgi:hypothetical protein